MQGFQAHVVEQQNVGTSRYCFAYLIHVFALDFDRSKPRILGTAHRFCEPAGNGKVVVLDQDPIGEVQAVILSTTEARGVFFEPAEARKRLPGIAKNGARAFDFASHTHW